MQVWTTKELETKVKKIISDKLHKAELLADLKSKFGKIAKWQLNDYSTTDFEEFLKTLAKA